MLRLALCLVRPSHAASKTPRRTEAEFRALSGASCERADSGRAQPLGHLVVADAQGVSTTLELVTPSLIRTAMRLLLWRSSGRGSASLHSGTDPPTLERRCAAASSAVGAAACAVLELRATCARGTRGITDTTEVDDRRGVALDRGRLLDDGVASWIPTM
eukprot:scaffold58854_cov26-Tisochrysis_lutea.AAC.4